MVKKKKSEQKRSYNWPVNFSTAVFYGLKRLVLCWIHHNPGCVIMIMLCKQMFKEEERKRTEIISFRKTSQSTAEFSTKIWLPYYRKWRGIQRAQRTQNQENNGYFNNTRSRWLILDFRGFHFRCAQTFMIII